MNPTKFQLRVGFRLRVAGTDENSKGLSFLHEWDFADPTTMRFPELMRQLRYSLLSIITTAAYTSVFGWLRDEELHERIRRATPEEYDRALALKRVADPPEDYEMGATDGPTQK